MAGPIISTEAISTEVISTEAISTALMIIIQPVSSALVYTVQNLPSRGVVRENQANLCCYVINLLDVNLSIYIYIYIYIFFLKILGFRSIAFAE